jgi:hypothetical protein
VKYLSHDTPTTMVAGQRYTVNVRLQNTGTIDWETDGPVPVGLTCRWLNEEGEIVPLAQTITFMPNVVKPGDTADVRTFVRAPEAAGAYTLQWDLKHGEELWFSEEAAPPLTVPVEVR